MLVDSSAKGDKLTSHGCGVQSHIKPSYPNNPRNFKKEEKEPTKGNFVFQSELKPTYSLIDLKVCVFGRKAEVLLDTGCSSVIVSSRLVPQKIKLGPFVKLYGFLGVPSSFPTVRCYVASKFFSGWVTALVAPLKFADILIGTIPGIKMPNDGYNVDDSEPVNDGADNNYVNSDDYANANNYANANSDYFNSIDNVEDNANIVMTVQTRAAKKKQNDISALPCPEFLTLNITQDDIVDAQKSCLTLETIGSKVESGEVKKVKDHSVEYKLIEGLIYRLCVEGKTVHEIRSKQLVVPQKYRVNVLNLAYDSLTAGHFSHRKTALKVFNEFFWPGAGVDVKRYCHSCPVCQKYSSKG